MTGVLASVICLRVFGADSFLIPAMVLILAVIFLVYRREGQREQNVPETGKGGGRGGNNSRKEGIGDGV